MCDSERECERETRKVSTCVCVGMCIYVYETVGLTVLECNTHVCGCGTVLKVRLERQRDLDRQLGRHTEPKRCTDRETEAPEEG